MRFSHRKCREGVPAVLGEAPGREAPKSVNLIPLQGKSTDDRLEVLWNYFTQADIQYMCSSITYRTDSRNSHPQRMLMQHNNFHVTGGGRVMLCGAGCRPSVRRYPQPPTGGPGQPQKMPVESSSISASSSMAVPLKPSAVMHHSRQVGLGQSHRVNGGSLVVSAAFLGSKRSVLSSSRGTGSSRGHVSPGRSRGPRRPRRSCRPAGSPHRRKPAGPSGRHRSG
jgi:hypothetical protein